MYQRQQNTLSCEIKRWQSDDSACFSAIRDSHMFRTLRAPAVCLELVSMATDQTVWLQQSSADEVVCYVNSHRRNKTLKIYSTFCKIPLWTC